MGSWESNTEDFVSKFVHKCKTPHDCVLQEAWEQATVHCEHTLDRLSLASEKQGWSIHPASDLGALCSEAGQTAYLLVT